MDRECEGSLSMRGGRLEICILYVLHACFLAIAFVDIETSNAVGRRFTSGGQKLYCRNQYPSTMADISITPKTMLSMNYDGEYQAQRGKKRKRAHLSAGDDACCDKRAQQSDGDGACRDRHVHRSDGDNACRDRHAHRSDGDNACRDRHAHRSDRDDAHRSDGDSACRDKRAHRSYGDNACHDQCVGSSGGSADFRPSRRRKIENTHDGESVISRSKRRKHTL